MTSVETKDKKTSPPPPFTTSTLQQEANRRLGFSAKQTMTIAQKLYEGVDIGEEGAVGLITYMRTDSVNMADKFLTEANDFITKEYGAKYALESPRKYKTKSKGAQEAHEAIRPTDPSRDPDLLVSSLDPGQLKTLQTDLATSARDANAGRKIARHVRGHHRWQCHVPRDRTTSGVRRLSQTLSGSGQR